MTTQTDTTAQSENRTQSVWKFDDAHTLIEFGVKHMMVTTVKGRFNDFEGTIYGDPEDPTGARAEVTIQAASIDTRNEQRDAHLRSADFLDVERYPTITFKSTRVEQLSKEHFHVTGDLTIRGVTKEIELDVALNGIGRNPYGMTVAGLTAETILTRADWGLTWNVALETGGVLVGNTAKVSIEIEAIKQSPVEADRSNA
jgi:polyisoprenoid-binding protein YceI